MLLAKYLRVNGLTLDQFAERIGRSAATVSRIARGLHKPDWETMEAIREATDGDVMPNDFSNAAVSDPAHSADKPSRKPRVAV